MLKELLSISEMAKLRRITAETLRHYDRIGLFKPAYIDPNTGYRFYSIYQYEVLGTIKELRQIGMNLEEIKFFLTERNTEKSMRILEKKHKILQRNIKELIDLEKSINEKIENFHKVSKEGLFPGIKIYTFEDRLFITKNTKISNDLELSYGVIEIENMMQEKAPLIASDRLGVLIEKEDLLSENYSSPTTLVARTNYIKDIPEKYVIRVPKGKFVCLRHYGEIWDRRESLTQLMTFIKKHDYKLTGNALQIVQVDISITDEPNEAMFEIQIPIVKH
ncbi:MerR family transcriptional regulator [Bacillus subtilis]|uniref:MerR family transcriptional regulator n=1 Tax=Bacillus subtilis TaxID=1423 RepID=UPI0011992AC7|nr:MerR family transcriptional regulator [Bacillus subtilis]MED0587418.1 MerR family transcriptional regulator [Bacillus subtilis]TWG73822.1 DNA-binding transcriptional MerR regulator [Bacillus subtilis J26]